MSIIRAKRPDSGFLILSNEVSRDDRISYRALGILTLILSRPDNWRTNYQQLARGEGREGQAAVLTALKELEAAGYLIRRRLRDSAGRWAWEHLVYDTPQAAPLGIVAGQTMSQEPRRGTPRTETCDSLEVPTTKNDEEDEMSRLDDPWATQPPAAAEPKSDWRGTDRALWAEIIGGASLTCDGSGPWKAGTFSLDSVYDAIRKGNSHIKAKKWPGIFLQGLQDWEDYLSGLGLEVNYARKVRGRRGA